MRLCQLLTRLSKQVTYSFAVVLIEISVIIIPMQPESDESSIERLKRTLYSRNEKLIPKEKRTPVAPREYDVPSTWGDKPDYSIPPETIVKRNNSFFNKFLIGSLLFFAVSVAIAVFIFFGGVNMISSNNLTVDVIAPTSVSSGEELSIGLSIVNGNRTDLEETKLFITYPEGAMTVGEDEKDIGHEEINLGVVPKGDSAEHGIRAVLFGEKDSIKTFNFRIEYKVKGSNAVFSKEKTYDVIIGSSPILLDVKYPKEVNSGQDVTLSVEVTSNSTVAIKDLLVKIDYPYGFTYKSSTIKPVRNDSVWSLGDLKNGDKKKFEIVGSLLGQNMEDRSFRISAGNKSGNVYDFDTVLVSNTITLGLRKSFFDLDITAGDDYIGKIGESIPVYIKWQNTLPDKVVDARMEIVLSGNSIDESKVNVLNGGYYSSVNDTVTWTKNENESLQDISPGDTGEFSLSLNSLPNLIQPKLIKNPHIDLRISMTGDRTGRDSGEVNSTQNVVIKISSVLNITSKTLRDSGPFTNTGLIPPKADKETTYTINWLLTNTTSDIKGTVVRAELPQGVSWKGETSPSTEKITYNPDSRIVTWDVGSVSAGSGFSNSPKQVYFKVGLVPSVVQVGTSPNLVSQVDVVSTDSFTEKQLKTNAGAVTTRFVDPSYVFGKEIVVK